jgi:hypothetical protein
MNTIKFETISPLILVRFVLAQLEVDSFNGFPHKSFHASVEKSSTEVKTHSEKENPYHSKSR